MKLENQVVSLELAQKMKELGFEQDSLFSYVEENIGEETEILSKNEILTLEENGIFVVYVCSAYTVAELGEMLNLDNLPVFERWHTENNKSYKGKKVWTFEIMDGAENYWFTADTEADARAKMLIYLKENNLI